MSTSPNDSDDKSVPPSSSTVILLLATIGDTTWRMFVPTVGLTVIGVLLDQQFDTLPWISLGGLLIGSIIAGFLIRQQLRKVK